MPGVKMSGQDTIIYSIDKDLEHIIKVCLIKKTKRLRVTLTLLSSNTIIVEGNLKTLKFLKETMGDLDLELIKDVEDYYAFDEFVTSRYPRLQICVVSDLILECITSVSSEEVDGLTPLEKVYCIISSETFSFSEFEKRWKAFYSSQLSDICSIEGNSYLWFILSRFDLKHRGVIKKEGDVYHVEILHDNPEFINPFSIRSSDIKVLSLEKEITQREAFAILYINRKYKGELLPLVGTKDILVKGGIQGVIIPTQRKYGFTKDDVDVFTTETISELSYLETWSLIRIGQNNICSLFDLYLYDCECKESKKPLTNPANRSLISKKITDSIKDKVSDIKSRVGKTYMLGFDPIELPKIDIALSALYTIKFSIDNIIFFTTLLTSEDPISYILTQAERPETLFSTFGQRKLSLGYKFRYCYLSPDIQKMISENSNAFLDSLSFLSQIESSTFASVL